MAPVKSAKPLQSLGESLEFLWNCRLMRIVLVNHARRAAP
jgi:hypothetical protein